MIYIKHISWGVIFMYAFQLHKHRRKISLFFRLCSSFFRNRIFLLSGFTRNHFMTGVDSHNHTEKRAASKIFVSRFHVFIAGIKGSNHGCQCTKWPIFMCFHLNIPPAFFYIIPLFRKHENRKFINSVLSQSAVPVRSSSQGSYQYWQTRYETPVHNSGG